MRVFKTVRSGLLVLVGSVVLAGCASSAAKPADLNDHGSSSKYQGVGATPPLPRPTFTLTDTTGAPYSFGGKTGGHPTLLYFGYTHCPDICPTTMADVGNAIREVPADLRATVEVVFVTTDVKQDTGSVMASWLRHFDTGLPNQFVGLTGTQSQIDAAQAAAHVFLAEEDGQQHSATVRLYGADDYSHVSFAQSSNLADQIAHDLKV